MYARLHSGAVAGAKRSTMGKKIWLTIHLRKFGYDVRVLRASVHSLGVMEGNQVSARRGKECVINRAMYLCNLRLRSNSLRSNERKSFYP